MTKQFEQLRKEVAQSDMNFWTKLAENNSEILSLMIQGNARGTFSKNYTKKDIKKQFALVMENEERRSQIELFI